MDERASLASVVVVPHCQEEAAAACLSNSLVNKWCRGAEWLKAPSENKNTSSIIISIEVHSLFKDVVVAAAAAVAY